MKSKVYVMFLAILVGMSGKVFAAANGDSMADRRPWAKEPHRSKLANPTYYIPYARSLTFEQLINELEVVDDEILTAETRLTEAEGQLKWEYQTAPGPEGEIIKVPASGPESNLFHTRQRELNDARYHKTIVTNRINTLDPDPSTWVKGSDD